MEHNAGRPSDAALVKRLCDGDENALVEVYDRHADAVFRLAFRLLGDRGQAEEVLQETYLALWNRAELFDATMGSLPGWLLAIARNRSVDRLRSQGRRPTVVPISAVSEGDEREDALEWAVQSGGLVAAASPGPDPQQAVDQGWLKETVRRALDGVPAAERQAIELAYYEELSQSEIAERLGWPLGTVKTRTRRALGRLRQSLVDVLGPELGARVAPPADLGGGADGPR